MLIVDEKAEKVDMLVGSVAIGLSSSGGFCAGSRTVIDHQVCFLHFSGQPDPYHKPFQRINGPSFVFSASMPALLSVSASEGINILRSTPSILTALQENVRAARAILDKVDCITIPSHPASPIIHMHIRPQPTSSLHPASAAVVPSSKPSNPTSLLPRDAATWDWDIETEEKLLQDVVEEALAQGVMITKAKRLRGQEAIDPRPSIRLAMTSALTKKETEKAVMVVKSSFVKVLGKRR